MLGVMTALSEAVAVLLSLAACSLQYVIARSLLAIHSSTCSQGFRVAYYRCIRKVKRLQHQQERLSGSRVAA